MTRCTLLAAATLLCSAASSAAQSSAPASIADLRTGDRVRVEYARGDLEVSSGGHFMTLANDSLTIEIRGVQHTFPQADVRRIQVPDGHQSSMRNALVGLGIGTLVGVVASEADRLIIHESSAPPPERVTVCDPECHPVIVHRGPGEYTRRPLVIGGGAALGALAGALFPSVRWRNLELRPSARGAAVSVIP